MAQAAVRSAISKQQTLRCDGLKFIKHISIQPPSGDFEAACEITLKRANLSKPQPNELACVAILTLKGIEIEFDDGLTEPLSYAITDIQYSLYWPPNVFVYLTKGSVEGFSLLNMIRCVDAVQSQTMFRYLQAASESRAKHLQRNKSPPVRPKPPAVRPKAKSVGSQKTRTVNDQDSADARDHSASVSALNKTQVERAKSASLASSSSSTSASDNPNPFAVDNAPKSPVVPKRTRTKAHKRIAIINAPPAASKTSSLPLSADPTNLSSKTDASSDGQNTEIKTSPALKRKGQNTDFTNPELALSEPTSPDSIAQQQTTLDAIPPLQVKHVNSSTSLGSLVEFVEADDKPGKSDKGRSTSPVARRRRFKLGNLRRGSTAASLESTTSNGSGGRRSLRSLSRSGARTRSAHKEVDLSILERDAFELTSGYQCFICMRRFASVTNFCPDCGVQIIDSLSYASIELAGKDIISA
eukprot:TRINITY_DN7973_c0_g1_i5.p1 TRINITY_DN7973_c0_g1~~TRINITY_DN7973_c0_g1_i5.p1  ORF type:complete len:470 (+),score=89.01 TRINITY_DN7973_c0_g1_i5:130-1539(+)